MTTKPGAYWLTSAQWSTGLVELLDGLERQTRAQQDTGVAELDDVVSLHPSTLTLLVARPGHGKTTVAKALAIREAARIRATGDPNERVVFATLEEDYRIVAMALAGLPWSVDQVFRRDSVDWAEARQRAVAGVHVPVELVAHPRVEKGLRPDPLSSTRLFEAVEVMRSEHGIRPTLVIVDYGQLLREGGGGEFRHQMLEAAQACHDLALRLECAVVAGIQASRLADQRTPYPIPEMADLAESAQWERAAENVLALWRPIRTHKDRQVRESEPEPVKIKGRDYPVTDGLLVVKVLKQRYRAGHGVIPVHMDPITYRLASLERPDVEPPTWTDRW